MSKLSEALAAMDKGTPGEWVAHISTTDTPKEHTESAEILTKIDGLVWKIATMNPKEKARHNAILIAAAPDALAWIKEALPWLEIRADELRYEIDAQETLIGPVLSDDCIGTMKSDLARLDALIARAKPEV